MPIDLSTLSEREREREVEEAAANPQGKNKRLTRSGGGRA